MRVLAKPAGGAGDSARFSADRRSSWCSSSITSSRLSLAQPRAKWFFKHLWELPILLLPFLRPLRLLSLAVVINTLQRAVGHTIRGRVIVYTACGAVAIVDAASLAILDAERDPPDNHSEINTLGDALWWAMTTVTTVGYGDLMPMSPKGRLVAVALMIGRHHLAGQYHRDAGVLDRATGRARRTPRTEAATAAQIDALHDQIRRLDRSRQGPHRARPDRGVEVEGSG